MLLESNEEYLLGKDILGRGIDKRIFSLSEDKVRKLRSFSKKELALRFNGFVIIDEQGEIIFEDRKRYALHFFPLSVIDYAKAMYNFERHKKPIPILSVDSHDVLQCDFKCQDCLSAHGTNFPIKKFSKDNFRMDLETYKRMLKAITDYSEKRGLKGVRFEQSGEGNPDYYRHRREILKYARELGMQSVYVSTGSKIDDSLRSTLVKSSSFIRISFPGIGEAYKYYSGQSEFTFTDALNGLGSIVKERDKQERKKDLMIGARVALRTEHSDSYFSFANKLKDIGIDSLQIVKIIVPEGKKPSDFSLTSRDVYDLEKTETLDDVNFNVSIPHGLDSIAYSREIENRSEFPTQCFSARFQPVLAGRSLFVCTISDIMYSSNLKLGTFANEEGELERFLSSENIKRVTTGIPIQCKSCSNIYDNMLLFSLQKLFRTNSQKLNFYEIIK